MVTSEERREVAHRLRDYARFVPRSGSAWIELVERAIGTFGDKATGIGCFEVDRDREPDDDMMRLADLIEPQKITEDTSDGYHTFRQLYYQRMMLFAVLVQEHKDCAWKTRNHEDGEPCFGGGWFLVTIDTPRGAYGYHFEEKYWRLFDCPELPKAKHWDGYTECDVNRLFSLLGYEVSGDEA